MAFNLGERIRDAVARIQQQFAGRSWWQEFQRAQESGDPNQVIAFAQYSAPRYADFDAAAGDFVGGTVVQMQSARADRRLFGVVPVAAKTYEQIGSVAGGVAKVGLAVGAVYAGGVAAGAWGSGAAAVETSAAAGSTAAAATSTAAAATTYTAAEWDAALAAEWQGATAESLAPGLSGVRAATALPSAKAVLEGASAAAAAVRLVSYVNPKTGQRVDVKPGAPVPAGFVQMGSDAHDKQSGAQPNGGAVPGANGGGGSFDTSALIALVVILIIGWLVAKGK